ncbi:MAG: DUF1214 domain-containing protein [Myxococcota bacterium]
MVVALVAALGTAALALVLVYLYGGEIQFRMRMIKQFVGAPREPDPSSLDVSEPDASIMDGSAWDEFCDALKRARRSVLDGRAPQDEATRAQGFRYLTSLLASGLTMYMFSDPDRPRFVRPLDWNVKWGLDNSDALYLVTAINPDGEYVIRGSRGTVGFFDIQTSCGRFGSNRPMKVLSSINGVDMHVEEDGTFEIVVSRQPREGNWLPLTPEANQIGVRQFFVDWDTEKAPEIRIERTDVELEPPTPSSHEIAKQLRRVSGFVVGSANLWLEFVLGRRPLHLNELSEPAGANELQGSNAQVYGSCYFRLAPSEALLIEVVPPEAAYWNFELGDFWFQSLDYFNRVISINKHQAKIDPDGVLRVVVSAQDPGLVNWLDTGGWPEGTMTYRWALASTTPQPSAKKVRLDEIANLVPANVLRATQEDRAEEIRRRRRHVTYRFNRG